MSTLIYYHDPKNILGYQKYILDTSLTIQQNLITIFPDGISANNHKIYLNNQEINPIEFDLNIALCEFDLIKVVRQQQGWEIVIAAVVAVVAAVLAVVLMPKASIPNSIDDQKDSSNNKLQGQTNRARVYQAIPDIYGCVRVYPDLLKPANSEYIDNVKYLEHFMCIGIGQYSLDQFKYDETLLNKIAGTKYKVYEPYAIIPEIRYAYASDEVDGQELVPPNLSDGIIFSDDYADIVDYSAQNGVTTLTLQAGTDVGYLSVQALPIQLNYYVNANVTSYNKGNTINTNTNIMYRGNLVSVIKNELGQPVLTINNVVFVKYMTSFSGSVTNTTITKNALSVEQTGDVYTETFILPEQGTEIWIDVSFARGLKGYAQTRFIYWAVDELGNEIANTRENYDWDLRADTYEPQFRTIKLKPKRGYGHYAIKCGRINNGNSDLTDQIKIENIYIVGYNYNFQMPNVTSVFITTKATTQATSLKELKFNVEATRKTTTYKNNVINKSLTATRSFADAVLHSYVEIFNRDASELDLDDLHAIDAKLAIEKPALRYFDFSFDDADISLGERIQTICNAARVMTYNDGIKWRFVRDEKKSIVSAMFSSANLISSSDGGTIQYNPSQSESYDGVEVEYIHASKDDRANGTDKKAYIRLRIVNGHVVEQDANNPYKIQLAGCRNKTQAMNRAQMEARRILYQRLTIEDEALYSDVALINKGDRVRWSDTYDEAVVSGEIVGINELQFTVNQTLELDKSKVYRVTITNKQGYPSEWLDVTSFDNSSFAANFNEAFIADGVDIQCGSTFLITEQKTGEINDFILTEKQYNDESFKITLSQYDERIYEYDAAN